MYLLGGRTVGNLEILRKCSNITFLFVKGKTRKPPFSYVSFYIFRLLKVIAVSTLRQRCFNYTGLFTWGSKNQFSLLLYRCVSERVFTSVVDMSIIGFLPLLYLQMVFYLLTSLISSRYVN